MMRQWHIKLQRLGWRIGAFLILWFMCEQRCLALQMALPDVGTDISYDFQSQTPVFEIANGAPAQEIIQSEVTFSDNKHLRVIAESDLHFLHIDLTLRAPLINTLFDGIFISFDETLSLLGVGASIAASAKNTSVTSVGNCDSYCDEYTFGWDFHPMSDFSFHGFQWNITPDLIQGVELPDTLTVETHMWAAGSILVVPEPSSVALTVVLVICMTASSRVLMVNRVHF